MLIIFDLDDTLIDTSGVITPFKLKECLASLIGSGVQVPEDAYAELLKENQTQLRSKDAFLSFAKSVKSNDEQIEKALGMLITPLPEAFKVPATPHAKEVLEYLRALFKLTLVTIGHLSFQQDKLKKAGIDSSLFSMIKVLKGPEKKIAYEEIQETFSLTSKEIWVCGDRIETDLRPAFELGFNTVHMRWGRGANYAKEDWVDHSINDLRELKEIIQ